MEVSAFTDENDASLITTLGVSLVTTRNRPFFDQGSTYDLYRPMFFNEGEAFKIARESTAGERDQLLNMTHPQFPMICTPYTVVSVFSTCTGAISGPGIAVNTIFWAGKRGTFPPGFG
jgi:hypothetical protein